MERGPYCHVACEVFRVEDQVGAIFAFRCHVEWKFTNISITKTQGWKVGSDFVRGPMVTVFGWEKDRLP